MPISDISRAVPANAFRANAQAASATTENGRQEVPASGNASPPAARGRALPEAANTAPTPQDTEKAVEVVQEFLQSTSRSLQFKVDESSGVEVVTVLDGETGEVIRSFPSEEVIASARYIAENSPDAALGILLDKES